MNTDANITTAEQAIAESIARNEIVHVCLSMDEADKLGLVAEDCAEQQTAPRLTEYWGTDDDGNAWRVHDHVEP